MRDKPTNLSLVQGFLSRYVEDTGDHNPVCRLLASAVNAEAWGIVSAQCQDSLGDFFTRRMMSDEAEDLLRQLGGLAEELRVSSGQPLATWSTSLGRWVMGEVAIGAWTLVGWKSHPPNRVAF